MFTPGPKTSFDHLRWFGWSWTIGGWIVRNRAMLYDVAAIEGPSKTSWRFLIMFKNLVTMPEIVEYRTIIARRRATYLDVMRRRGCLYHIFTCSHVHGLLTMSCHGRATSYDIVRDRTTTVRLNHFQMLTSASRQTIIVKSYDLVRLSYDGRTMSY